MSLGDRRGTRGARRDTNKAVPRPTRADLIAAANRTIRDALRPGLRVVFCGINPGLYTAWAGHHFARPGNRFWPALHAGGFTRRVYSPWEDQDLLELGLGLTNLVPRASAQASELTAEELMKGAAKLERKLRRNPTRWIAFLGIGAYRTAFQRPRALLGAQEERLAGARIWLLPSPSGLNANHQLPEIASQFRALRNAVSREP